MMFGFIKKLFKNTSNNETINIQQEKPKDDMDISLKIVENDNALRDLVPDYKEREKKAIDDFESRLGKALPNDVVWSILQDLMLECWETTKDTKLLVNVEYQMGLLLQKEKKYKDAITHYSMGLYYLVNFYPHDMKPQNHIIDYVTEYPQLIEMGQYKFINKIKRCINLGKIDLDDLIKSIQHITTRLRLSKYSSDDLIKDILMLTRDCYFSDDDDELKDKNEEFDYSPASFKKYRTYLRKNIREEKKNKVDLNETLNTYYKFCVMQQILYGYYPLKSGVNGFYSDIVEYLAKDIKEKVKDVSFLNNGYLEGSDFISNNDYKTFINYYGQTDKRTDFKVLYDSDFQDAILHIQKKDEKEFSLSYDSQKDLIILANKTRNNQFD